MRGSVKVQYLDDVDHPWYHQDCAICGNWISSRRVAIQVSAPGMESSYAVNSATYMHRHCLEVFLEKSQKDDYVAREEGILRRKDRLTSWALSNVTT